MEDSNNDNSILQFEITIDDCKLFFEETFYNKKILKSRITNLIVLPVIFAGVFLSIIGLLRASMFFFACGLILIVTFSAYFSNEATKTRKQVEKSKFSDRVGNKTLKFTPAGVELNTKHKFQTIFWETIEGIHETNSFVVVLIKDGSLIEIPKRVFQNEEVKSEFLNRFKK